MEQYALIIPRQVYSGPAGMQALAALAVGHKKAAVFTDGGILASGVLELPLEEIAARADLELEQAQKVVEILRAEFGE